MKEGLVPTSPFTDASGDVGAVRSIPGYPGHFATASGVVVNAQGMPADEQLCGRIARDALTEAAGEPAPRKLGRDPASPETVGPRDVGQQALEDSAHD